MDIRNNRNDGVRLLLAAILTCVMLGLFGQLARAQSVIPSDTILYDTSKIYSISDFRSWYIEYKPGIYIPAANDELNIPQTSPIQKNIDTDIKASGFEVYIGTPWISERNKSAIIEYLINLIIELIEPGETITIKKVE